MFQKPNRNIVPQEFFSGSMTVGTTILPLSQAINAPIQSMITSIILSVPTGQAQSVFMGGPSVATNTGAEIVPGVPVNIVIENERVLYELQAPLQDAAAGIICQVPSIETIPIIVWDLNALFFVAAANTVMGFLAFKNMYV